LNLEEAIEHTKNKRGFKVSITGIASRIFSHRGAIDKGQKYLIKEFGRHFDQARQSWLNGDLETVAEFFGLYS
jgi:hypothetical protein